MPICPLLFNCFTSESSCSENQSRIEVDRRNLEENEEVLFFLIDENLNPRSNFKKLFDLDNEEPICDCIVLYRDIDESLRGSVSVAFIELKGSEVSHAKEHIINTKRKLKPILKKVMTSGVFNCDIFQQIEWKAYVNIGPTSSPHQTKQHRLELEKKFNNADIKRKSNIENFLRG